MLSNEMISAGIYSMWLENRAASLLAKPGQFISVYCEDKSRLLPRPISICEVKKEESMLRIVYRVAGEGTEEFSHYKPKCIQEKAEPKYYTKQNNLYANHSSYLLKKTVQEPLPINYLF